MISKLIIGIVIWNWYGWLVVYNGYYYWFVIEILILILFLILDNVVVFIIMIEIFLNLVVVK